MYGPSEKANWKFETVSRSVLFQGLARLYDAIVSAGQKSFFLLFHFIQVGSPRPSESPTCAGVLGLVEQQDPLATEAMSDGEVLPPTAPFTRGCKARASLPVGRSSGQTRERPLGK